MKTMVGTPDHGNIRQARLEWVAASLRLPAALLDQALDAKRRKDKNGEP